MLGYAGFYAFGIFNSGANMLLNFRDGPAARFIALQGAYDTLRSRNSNIM